MAKPIRLFHDLSALLGLHSSEEDLNSHLAWHECEGAREAYMKLLYARLYMEILLELRKIRKVIESHP